eukprot:m.133809 g.133809  ORF g.133809 m.133809 type:complete len:86 (-) comp17548_c0_seq1:1659-1916(-)
MWGYTLYMLAVVYIVHGTQIPTADSNYDLFSGFVLNCSIFFDTLRKFFFTSSACFCGLASLMCGNAVDSMCCRISSFCGDLNMER